MNKIILEFNPVFNSVHDLMEVQRILSALIQRREAFRDEVDICDSANFLAAFDTLTQNFIVKQLTSQE